MSLIVTLLGKSRAVQYLGNSLIVILFSVIFATNATGEEVAARARSFNVRENCVVRQLYETVIKDPTLGITLKRNLQDRDLLLSDEIDPKIAGRSIRRPLLALTRDPEFRPIVIDSILADLRSRSEQISSRITDAMAAGKIDEASQVYDYAVIGTGIHDQIFNNVITAKNPGLKGISIGDGDGISENFALADEFFRINSSNRPSKAGVVPKPGVGNLNEFPEGIVQAPDLDSSRFPPARVLSDAATINRSVDSADVLFRHRVKDVARRGKTVPESADWPAQYRIELEDAFGNKKYVFADKIVNAGGLGKPNIPLLDSESQNIIAQEFNKAAQDPDAPTTLISFEDAIRRASRTDNPYQPYRDKDIAIIGGRDVAKGDSSKVFIEWLTGFAPRKSYGNDVAQLGRFRSIDWVGVSARDCREYINNTRARYADIATAFKDKTLQGVDGKLESVSRLPSGRWRLAYRLRDGQTQTVEKDVVIFATGFESDASSRFKSIKAADDLGIPFGPDNPIQESTSVQLVTREVPGISGFPVVGKKLKDEDIWFVGPDAGAIVKADEQAGVTENVASIFATGPRTAEVAKEIAETSPRGFQRLERVKPEVPDFEAPDRIPVISRESVGKTVRRATLTAPIYLSNRINRELNTFIVERDTPVSIFLTRIKTGGYALTSEPPIRQISEIAQELARDPAFIERAASFLDGNPRGNRLRWDAVLAPKRRSRVRTFAVEDVKTRFNLDTRFEPRTAYRQGPRREFSYVQTGDVERRKAQRAFIAAVRVPNEGERFSAIRQTLNSPDLSVTVEQVASVVKSFSRISNSARFELCRRLTEKIPNLKGEDIVKVAENLAESGLYDQPFSNTPIELINFVKDGFLSIKSPTEEDLYVVLRSLRKPVERFLESLTASGRETRFTFNIDYEREREFIIAIFAAKNIDITLKVESEFKADVEKGILSARATRDKKIADEAILREKEATKALQLREAQQAEAQIAQKKQEFEADLLKKEKVTLREFARQLAAFPEYTFDVRAAGRLAGLRFDDFSGRELGEIIRSVPDGPAKKGLIEGLVSVFPRINDSAPGSSRAMISTDSLFDVLSALKVSKLDENTYQRLVGRILENRADRRLEFDFGALARIAPLLPTNEDRIELLSKLAVELIARPGSRPNLNGIENLGRALDNIAATPSERNQLAGAMLERLRPLDVDTLIEISRLGSYSGKFSLAKDNFERVSNASLTAFISVLKELGTGNEDKNTIASGMYYFLLKYAKRFSFSSEQARQCLDLIPLDSYRDMARKELKPVTKGFRLFGL